jgi:hypothetical protein
MDRALTPAGSQSSLNPGPWAQGSPLSQSALGSERSTGSSRASGPRVKPLLAGGRAGGFLFGRILLVSVRGGQGVGRASQRSLQPFPRKKSSSYGARSKTHALPLTTRKMLGWFTHFFAGCSGIHNTRSETPKPRGPRGNQERISIGHTFTPFPVFFSYGWVRE